MLPLLVRLLRPAGRLPGEALTGGYGVIAMAERPCPTLIGFCAALVAVLIGVTVRAGPLMT